MNHLKFPTLFTLVPVAALLLAPLAALYAADTLKPAKPNIIVIQIEGDVLVKMLVVKE